MVDTANLPVNTGKQSFNSWEAKFSESHILHSKCSMGTECSQEGATQCFYCLFNNELDLPHLPDMVFPNNTLSMQHTSGCTIQFKALDALKHVSNNKLPTEISCADSWRESRMDSGHMDKVKSFDWTFTSDYAGTLTGDFDVSVTDARIDMDKLRRKEPILLYKDITLFEDELHDNGTAICNVKMRVMPSGFFVLLRYFLRVDNVLLRINDTRYYHEFGTDFVLREYSSKEAKISEINVPIKALDEPSAIAELLPLVVERYEKLTLPTNKEINQLDGGDAEST